MSEQPGDLGAPGASETADSPPGFSLLRVVKVVTPFLLFGLGCFVAFGIFDGVGWLRDLMKPPLVQSTGQVLMNGKPLAHAEVRTKPTTSGVAGAIGFVNERGEFVLQTEIKGDRVDGAYVGEHRVTVAKYGMAQGPFAPLIVPEEYASFETTPLSIIVSRDPSENKFSIALEGAPAESGRDAGGPEPATENTGPDPLHLTSMVFQKLDRDGDGRLSVEELEGLNKAQKEAAASADRDGDGVISQQDLYGVVGRSAGLFEEFAETAQE